MVMLDIEIERDEVSEKEVKYESLKYKSKPASFTSAI
jgi:hypothetical protein